MCPMDLRAFRTQQGWTLDQLGRLIGVSGVTVHRWETRKARPSLDDVETIERVSGGMVTVSDFMRAAGAVADAAPASPPEAA